LWVYLPGLRVRFLVGALAGLRALGGGPNAGIGVVGKRTRRHLFAVVAGHRGGAPALDVGHRPSVAALKALLMLSDAPSRDTGP
jgi:hypothetical protein